MQESLFTVAKLDDFVPEDHPARAVQQLVNAALTEMNARFNEIYAPSGLWQRSVGDSTCRYLGVGTGPRLPPVARSRSWRCPRTPNSRLQR
jgi:hypothetical protein